MKGRIIGREGRNIRTFEKADRRGRDRGRHARAWSSSRRSTTSAARPPASPSPSSSRTAASTRRRIEEVVAETQTEMEKHIAELGKQAVLDADVPMPHEKLVYLLGRLRFRTSYSQNVLAHSVEVAHLCGLMAARTGAEPAARPAVRAAARRRQGGRPRDGGRAPEGRGGTGEAVRRDEQGGAARDRRAPRRRDGRQHLHGAGRGGGRDQRQPPGARRETLEKYVKRLEELEAVACGFPEVEHAYAIQAGRELRVIANAHKTTRRGRGAGVPRHRPGDRAAARLPRRDQGDGDPRDPQRGRGEVRTWSRDAHHVLCRLLEHQREGSHTAGSCGSIAGPPEGSKTPT